MPVALNLQVEADREDAQGDFFRRINKAPFPETNKMPYFTGASGRVHGMTASGKFLCAHTPGAICRDCDPRTALKGWHNLPERERMPGAIKVGSAGKASARVATPPPGQGKPARRRRAPSEWVGPQRASTSLKSRS